MHRPLISRRHLLHQCLQLTVPILASSAQPQVAPGGGHGVVSNTASMPFVKVFKNAGLLDISPDSRKLCLYFSRHPSRSFGWHDQWEETTRPIRDGEDALRVVNMESWQSVFEKRLPTSPYLGSFFADSEAIYVGIPGLKSGHEHLIIELRTNRSDERIDPYREADLEFSYSALDDRTLLGWAFRRGNGSAKTEVLVKAKLPSYEEIQRAPYAENRNPSLPRREAPITVAADRRTFVYAVDDKIVCRSTDNLSVKWTRQIDPQLGLWRTGISGDGRFIAVSAFSGASEALVGRSHVGVFSGEDGKLIARIPVDGREGVAISPDGKLLAAGYRLALHGKTAGTQPTIAVFEISSGRKLATLVQDQFWDGGKEFLYAGFTTHGIQFTPDGKYLITSGLNTKIWKFIWDRPLGTPLAPLPVRKQFRQGC
jgi:WD40 repeat protein